MLTPPRYAAMLAAAFAIASLLAARVLADTPSPSTIVLREQLNQSYGPELLVFPFLPANDACRPESIQVTGPRGPVSAQLTDVETAPEKPGLVRRARLAVLVDELKPRSSSAYTIAYGKSPSPKVSSDLAIAFGKDQVRITTAHAGVCLILGGDKFATPKAIHNAPGILLASRMGNGDWAGGSRFTGDAKITEWSSRLTDAGPAFARVLARYVLDDGTTLTVAATLVAGDSAVRWDMNVSKDRPDLAIEFRLPPVPGVRQYVIPKGYGQWSRADRAFPLAPGPEPFNRLSPNTSLVHIFPDCAWSVRLAPAGGQGMQITSRDAGAWTDPVAPLTYGGFKSWHLTIVERSWENWRRKRVPMIYGPDGAITMQATLAKGQRKWLVSAGTPRVGESLDKTKELVLDWPSNPNRPHPRLFVDQKDVQAAWTRAGSDPEFAKMLEGGDFASLALRVLMKPADKRVPHEVEAVVGRLRDQLALLGDFDVMRAAIGTASLYDALIDSGQLTPQDKALFRAQMAYLGYLMADPQVWSIERGYISGNPNMSVSYTLSLGVIAATLADHPKAREWADRATQWADKWLNDEVGAGGEWLPEGSHYGYVSLEPLIAYAIAAQRAGFHDFTNDPRLKKVIAYFAKTNTPRDPQRGGFRVIGAWGRGTSGDRLAVFGPSARMTAKVDPAFSRTMQYLWAENGYPVYLSDSRMGGFEPYYVDTRLPAAAPAWTSERFPELGVFLRSAYGTPQESHLNFLACVDPMRNLDVWTPGVGAVSQWFGRGKPLSTCWTNDTGYAVRHELLRDGVRLARNWGQPEDPKAPFGHYTRTDFGCFADLPTVDYVRSRFVYTKPDDRDWFPAQVPPAFPRVTPAREAKLDWTRQLLFVKDSDPLGPAWVAVRDTTRGGQPNVWQFWTLSEKLGSADQAKDPSAFLSDKPGESLVPAHELPRTNCYTALGKLGVDLDYFIASPVDTPRHTLRYGGFDYVRTPEWQDLLHLQLPGDGHYFVALFPRPRSEPAPAFTTLADGNVIKVVGPFGTDFAFLAEKETSALAEGVRFQGTAGSFQRRQAWSALSLASGGKIEWSGYSLAGNLAASLRVTADRLVLTLPTENPGGHTTLTLDGAWRVSGHPMEVNVDHRKGGYRIDVPKGPMTITFVKST